MDTMSEWGWLLLPSPGKPALRPVLLGHAKWEPREPPQNTEVVNLNH